MGVSYEKKNAAFVSIQKFSIRDQNEKLPKFVCLCKMGRITEVAEEEKKSLRIQHLDGRQRAEETT